MPQNAHETITTEQLEPLVVAGQVDLDGLGQLRTGMLCRRVNKRQIQQSLWHRVQPPTMIAFPRVLLTQSNP